LVVKLGSRELGRLHALADRRGLPVDQLLREALGAHLDRWERIFAPEPPAASGPTSDEWASGPAALSLPAPAPTRTVSNPTTSTATAPRSSADTAVNVTATTRPKTDLVAVSANGTAGASADGLSHEEMERVEEILSDLADTDTGRMLSRDEVLHPLPGYKRKMFRDYSDEDRLLAELRMIVEPALNDPRRAAKARRQLQQLRDQVL
jgi:hypothetical protein